MKYDWNKKVAGKPIRIDWKSAIVVIAMVIIFMF